MTDVSHIDHQSITERQQATWATGDFNVISRLTMPMSEALVQGVDPHAGQRVLDVACGAGNAALVAGRRFCEVTGIDYVPELIERARMRAAADGVDIDFRVGDAQALPFPDASFDVVLSAIGVMFAPDQEKAASELLRVCRPGGRIGLASWMPEAFGGDFFAAHARYVPPPPGIKPPTRWGTEAGLIELLGAGVSPMQSERRSAFAYFHSTAHAVEVHRAYFGPTIRAFETVSEETHERLWGDIEDVFRRYNRAIDGTAVVEYEYLQTIAIRSQSVDVGRGT
ncbi:MAG: class I SAM-dependent methyltransferase [Chloroflexota bacterium]